MSAKAGVGILTSPQWSECVLLDSFEITGMYVEAQSKGPTIVPSAVACFQCWEQVSGLCG